MFSQGPKFFMRSKADWMVQLFSRLLSIVFFVVVFLVTLVFPPSYFLVTLKFSMQKCPYGALLTVSVMGCSSNLLPEVSV